MEVTRGRGRPLTPLNPDASASALLGAKLRAHRLDKGLTLKALADLIGYSQQHISEVERAKSTPAQPFIAACDSALDANGALLELLPAATDERRQRCKDRSTARRTADDPALRCDVHSDAGEDVEPTNRRGLLGAGAAAALGGVAIDAAPAAAREVDPDLPAHWAQLLSLLGRHDDAFGPHAVLGTVQRELRIIADHRAAARGELRTALMRVEARYAEFAAWLSNDLGDPRRRDAWTNRAASLAQASDYADMAALTRERRAQWAAQEHDARRTIASAEDALRVHGVSAQTRALCARQAACGHALDGDAAACERWLAEVEVIMDSADSTAPPWTGGAVDRHLVRSSAARCMALLEPRKAISMYEDVLLDWPRGRVRTGGLQRARLALACAAAGELDRAEAEGRKALAVARATKSASAFRELHRLRRALGAEV